MDFTHKYQIGQWLLCNVYGENGTQSLYSTSKLVRTESFQIVARWDDEDIYLVNVLDKNITSSSAGGYSSRYHVKAYDVEKQVYHVYMTTIQGLGQKSLSRSKCDPCRRYFDSYHFSPTK